MNKEELSIKIMEVREENDSHKEQILSDKLTAIEDLQMQYHKKLQDMASGFDDNPDIKMIWDSANEKFYATQR